jgi:uncharacterized protein (DUF1330 family)
VSAYAVFHYDITNPDGYGAYAAAAGPSVYQYGGEVLAAGPDVSSLEGDKPGNVVVLKFPSVEAAQKWYDSPEYQAALPHRLDNIENATAFIAPEFTPPS